MTVQSESVLADAARLLGRRVGLRLDPALRGRLARCITAEADNRGLNVDSYVATLDADGAALQGLLNRVTVQETAFFRDAAQFEALADHVLPMFDEPVTIWSAGCANGQEPYSIAMVLDELGHTESRVCATDISTLALDRTRQARYSAREIGDLSPARRNRYVSAVADSFEIVPELRARVDVGFHNLSTDPPPFAPGSCPVVLCRNVLIYFSHDDIVRLLDRIADWLPPGGWLFLGYSESLWQVTERFQLVRVGDAFVYRRRDPSASGSTTGRIPPAEQSPRHRAARRLAKIERAPRRTLTERVSRPSVPTLGIDEFLALGEAAIEAGDHTSAVAAFRKCAYLDPDQPVTHLHLGLALEASGDMGAARRAYSTARTTLDACDTAEVEAMLDGYQVDDLARLLDRKLVKLT